MWGDLVAIEDTLQSSIAPLARDLGWRRTIRCRLAPLDLPEISAAWPREQHTRTSAFKFTSCGDVELLINKSMIEMGRHSHIGCLAVYVWLFGAAIERFPALRGEYTCVLGDISFWNALAFSSNHPEACLIPDPHFFASGGWADFRATMAADRIPWQARIPKVFWRGSGIGIKRYWPPIAADDMFWLPRAVFCSRARSSSIAPDIDVGLTRWLNIPDLKTLQILEKSTLIADFVPKEKFAQYKYVFDIDGNSNSWQGLFTSLLTAACVIKIQSEHGFRQWYYDRLVPWTHYVPVRSDFSDLENKVRWVLDNDDRAREIGEAGCALAQSIDYNAELDAAVGRLVAWCCRGNGGRKLKYRGTAVVVAEKPQPGQVQLESPFFDHEPIQRAVRSGQRREAVAGHCDEIGPLQYRFLLDQGLQRRHTLLDIGCGSLRGGVDFIRYLDAGNYIGVDIAQSLSDAGFEVELKAAGLQDKLPRENLICITDFEFGQLGRSVDFALADAVFTHLTFNRIRRCLERLACVMRIGGRFFATFFELPRDACFSQPYMHRPGGIVTYDTSDPYHYKLADLFFAASGLPWQIRYSGGWQHPQGQRMLEFIRMSSSAKPISVTDDRTIERPGTPSRPEGEASIPGMPVAAAPGTPDFAVVSAADAKYFDLLQGMVRSLREKPQGRNIALYVFDIGLSGAQRHWLLSRGAALHSPESPPYWEGLPAYLRTFLSRCRIPELLPGHDVYLWIDADAWIQRWDAVESYVESARRTGFAITPEIDAAYDRDLVLRVHGPSFAMFGPEYLEQLRATGPLNAGVFAGRADAPQWRAWRQMIDGNFHKAGTDHNLLFLFDQTALNIVCRQADFQAALLPATCNWISHFAHPMTSDDGGVLLRPLPPHEPLGIVHQTAGTKWVFLPLRRLGGGVLSRTLSYATRHIH
jgi:hypothetical protein